MNLRLRFSGAMLAALSAVSCQGPVDYAVRGVVRLDGRPLANACINYLPAGPGEQAIGTTDEAGRYVLHTDSSSRVPAGNYSVIVSSCPPSKGDGQPSAATIIIPDRYGRPEASGLKIAVPSHGAEAYDLELTSP